MWDDVMKEFEGGNVHVRYIERSSGSRISGFTPLDVRTSLSKRQIVAQARVRNLPEGVVARDVGSHPNRRFVEVEEIAALPLYLCGIDVRQ